MFIAAARPAAMECASPERVRKRKERFDQVAAISFSVAHTLSERLGGMRRLGIRECVPAAETRMATNMIAAASMPYLAKPAGLVWPVAWCASGTSRKLKVTR